MFISFLFLLAYCFFIVWLLTGYKNITLQSENIVKNNYFISIIIAARNESENIPELIKSLINQSYPNDKYEIIIVNDRSKDSSSRLLKDLSSFYMNLSYINITNTPENWAPKKWAIYNGILKAKGEIIIQTDADCLLGNNWVKSMVSGFTDSSIGFISSLTPLKGNKVNLFNDLFLMDSLAQDLFSGYVMDKGLTLSCNARSIAFKKDDFIKVKGYKNISHIISGDDDLLLHKIIHYIGCKAKFILNEDSVVYSKPPLNFNEFINQRLRYASKGIFYYKSKFISNELKLILPFLYIINLIACINILKFCISGSWAYLFLLLLKIIPDYFLLNPIYGLLKVNWNWISFIFLSIIHPFYILTFGIISPFNKYEWK